jgi:hypothetical protein
VVDLEEILGRVRDPLAKDQLKEAINCYHAGSFRAAIVATWVAVVFDFIAKLRELDMTGNQAARAKLTALEAVRTNHDLPQLLAFEKGLVKAATVQFELISPVEAIDLDRLFEDRNRCAHPSLTALEDIFRPSAELARTHIVAAVNNMLGQAPVQGTTAASKIFAEVGSDYFPLDAFAAAEYLKHGPLGRAKNTLVRSVVVGITKDLMKETRSTIERKRQFAALNALSHMYPEQFNQVLSDNLGRIAESVDEALTRRIILYVGQVRGAWERLGTAAQLRSLSFVENAGIDSIDVGILRALDVPKLREKAIARIPELGSSALARMLQARPEELFKERAFSLFERSSGFRDAESNLRGLVLPFAATLSKRDMERIASALIENRQIRFANESYSLLFDVFEKGNKSDEQRASWEIIYNAACEDDDPGRSSEIRDALRDQFGFRPCELQEIAQIEDDDDIPF